MEWRKGRVLERIGLLLPTPAGFEDIAQRDHQEAAWPTENDSIDTNSPIPNRDIKADMAQPSFQGKNGGKGPCWRLARMLHWLNM